MKATFVTREFGKNPADITKEEFIKMAIEDIEKAKSAYKIWSSERAEERYKKDSERHAEYREKKIKDITNASYKKYKREYYRQRWVMQEIAKIPRDIKRGYCHTGKELTIISWNYKPWDMFRAQIDVERNSETESDLEHIYNELIRNKYFLHSTGWSIVEDSLTEFKLHLSEDMMKEWKADEKNLSDAVSSFYEGSNYWGD